MLSAEKAGFRLETVPNNWYIQWSFNGKFIPGLTYSNVPGFDEDLALQDLNHWLTEIIENKLIEL